MEDKMEEAMKDEIARLFGDMEPVKPNIADRRSMDYQEAYNEGQIVNSERKSRGILPRPHRLRLYRRG